MNICKFLQARGYTPISCNSGLVRTSSRNPLHVLLFSGGREKKNQRQQREASCRNTILESDNELSESSGTVPAGDEIHFPY